jgi:hypothetical protein
MKKMKVITNYELLVGKTISFAHMAQFADQITLATTDGEVLMATVEVDEDFDDTRIYVFNQWKVINSIQNDSYLQEKLNKLGIFNLAEWKKEQEERQRKEREERLKAKEDHERKEYERLKAKFENADS